LEATYIEVIFFKVFLAAHVPLLMAPSRNQPKSTSDHSPAKRRLPPTILLDEAMPRLVIAVCLAALKAFQIRESISTLRKVVCGLARITFGNPTSLPSVKLSLYGPEAGPEITANSY
jgi:hypothetical protein